MVVRCSTCGSNNIASGTGIPSHPHPSTHSIPEHPHQSADASTHPPSHLQTHPLSRHVQQCSGSTYGTHSGGGFGFKRSKNHSQGGHIPTLPHPPTCTGPSHLPTEPSTSTAAHQHSSSTRAAAGEYMSIHARCSWWDFHVFVMPHI